MYGYFNRPVMDNCITNRTKRCDVEALFPYTPPINTVGNFAIALLMR